MNINFSRGKVHSLDHSLSLKEREFYQSIYKNHHTALCRFLFRVLKSQDNVEDVAQGVYLRIVRQNEPDKLEQNPRSYLFTIAMNLVRDNIRRENTRREVSQGQQYIDDGVSPVLSPENQVKVHQSMVKLKEAIKQLSSTHRDILILHRFHNLTCREIASERNLSLRSVQRFLSEALAYCQSKLRLTR